MMNPRALYGAAVGWGKTPTFNAMMKQLVKEANERSRMMKLRAPAPKITRAEAQALLDLIGAINMTITTATEANAIRKLTQIAGDPMPRHAMENPDPFIERARNHLEMAIAGLAQKLHSDVSELPHLREDPRVPIGLLEEAQTLEKLLKAAYAAYKLAKPTALTEKRKPIESVE